MSIGLPPSQAVPRQRGPVTDGDGDEDAGGCAAGSGAPCRIDGPAGTESWKAFQRCFKEYWGCTAAIDGDPRPQHDHGVPAAPQGRLRLHRQDRRHRRVGYPRGVQAVRRL